MGDERGQASVELVAVVPLLVLVVAAAAQLAATGWALWSAGNAARVGARAVHVGSDAEAAALRALPRRLQRGAKVRKKDAVTVRVRVPGVVPGMPRIPVSAGARLDPLGGDG